MIETSDQIEPVYPSATVVLVRDGEQGMEALLVQRNKALKHMGGMWVFPGGRVEAVDCVAGSDDYDAALRAAIRETEEEAGLTLQTDQLVYLSHWTTPEGAKKRFATWFFLAILSDGQEVIVDGGEIANHRWVCPKLACREAANSNEQLRLMPPTFVSLTDVSPFPDCDSARTALSQRQPVIYEPRMVFVEDGICFLYAGDAGYADESLDVVGSKHRFYMIDGQLEYVRDIQVIAGVDA